MVKVIVINGAGTSGKDTFIDMFTEICESQGNYSVYRFSSVDEVKNHATNMGWDGVKDDKGRRFLSDIKDAMTRYNNAPFEYMKHRIEEVIALETITKGRDAFIFFHVREPAEIQKVVESFGAVSLIIDRPSVDSDSFTNHADKNVNGFNYEYRVINYGTLLDLKDQAFNFFHYLKRR